MTEAQKKFIQEAGPKWLTALRATTLFVRNDSRFVGLDKVRVPIAFAAALEALGGQFPRPTIVTRTAIKDPEIAAELDKLIDAAADAARKELEKAA